MAKRHVEKYFDEVVNQYKTMLDEIRDFEETCCDVSVDSNTIENMKKIIGPLKNNYMALSYFMYLLNLPNREHKEKKFKERNKLLVKNKEKIFDKINEENDESIKKLKEENFRLRNL